MPQEPSSAHARVPATTFSPHRPQPEPPPPLQQESAPPSAPPDSGQQPLHIPQTDGPAGSASDCGHDHDSTTSNITASSQSAAASLRSRHPSPVLLDSLPGPETISEAPHAHTPSSRFKRDVQAAGGSPSRLRADALAIPQTDGPGDGASQGSGRSKPGKQASDRAPLTLTPSKAATDSRASGPLRAGNESEADSRPYARRHALALPLATF